MRITNRLHDLRRRAGKTQAEVIEDLTTSLGRRPFTRQMLSAWEKGRYQVSGDHLAILCAYFKVTPGDVLQLENGGGST